MIHEIKYGVYLNLYHPLADVTPPKIENCPLGFNRTSSTSVERFWMDPTASDNSGEEPIPTTPSDEPLQVDEQRVISYQFRDRMGNVAECSFEVSIKGQLINFNFVTN